jgi:hypothetical protein
MVKLQWQFLISPPDFTLLHKVMKSASALARGQTFALYDNAANSERSTTNKLVPRAAQQIA